MTADAMVVTHVQQAKTIGMAVEQAMCHQRVSRLPNPGKVRIVVHDSGPPGRILVEVVVWGITGVGEAQSAHVLGVVVVGKALDVAGVVEVPPEEQQDATPLSFRFWFCTFATRFQNERPGQVCGRLLLQPGAYQEPTLPLTSFAEYTVPRASV